MDIVSHTLWTFAGAKYVKKATKLEFNVRWSTFWGVFPDLFSFTLLFLWAYVQIVTGNYTPGNIPTPSDIEPASSDTFLVFKLTSLLYSLSHSGIVFVALFALIFSWRRRIPWELLGWAFHIAIDLFTHSYEFFPTPILWPISTWKFDGLPWHTPWFMAVNFTSLATLYIFMFRKELVEYLMRFKKRQLVFVESKNEDEI